MDDSTSSNVGSSSSSTSSDNPVAKMQQKIRAALQRFPRLKRCSIFKNDEDAFALTLSWPDGEADKTKTAIQRFSSTGPLGCAQQLPANVVVQIPSPTNRRVATLIMEDAESEKKKLRVEVWDVLKGQIASVQVEDVHGPFLAGEGLSWHDSEEMFAYVADKKAPSTVQSAPPHEAFRYREDWGEQYDGVVQPSVVLFDLASGKATTAVPSSKSQFYPVFSPTNKAHPPGIFALAYTAVEHDPFKLGLIYCAQRPSEVRMAVFQRSSGVSETSLKNDVAVSSAMQPGSGVAKSPRFSPEGSRLVFLSAPPFATHQTAMQLAMVDVDLHTMQASSRPKIVVDIDPTQEDDDKVRFPSLYLEGLPQQCFHGNDIVCLTTQHLSRRRILRVNLADGSLRWIGEKPLTKTNVDDAVKKQKLTPATSASVSQDIYSRGVLAVSPNRSERLLIVQSSPTNPGVVGWVSLFPERVSEDANIQPVLDLGIQVSQDICTDILSHRASPDSSDDKKKRKDDPLNVFESILIYPAHALALMDQSHSSASGHKEKLPLILFPHGGPHSAFTTDYSGEMAFICEELKTGILFVNYRGSIGAPSVKTLQTLPGKCGDQDVKDCMQALKDCLVKYNHVFDEKRIAVMGGSHGGFLTAHLSGQHPDVFKCATLRNPVIDIAAMSTVTDIPDWCYVEAMGLDGFDFKAFSNFPPNPKHYEAMFQQSPMRYVDAVKAPTLIAIGDKDRRVPPSQGIAYYRALKVRGVDVTLMRFPKDSHPIDRAGSNEIQWAVSIEFLKTHLESK